MKFLTSFQKPCTHKTLTNLFFFFFPDILNSQKLRLIKIVEIYLSIFECSTERHCNPRYDASILLIPSDSEISIKEEPSVIADATQVNFSIHSYLALYLIVSIIDILRHRTYCLSKKHSFWKQPQEVLR